VGLAVGWVFAYLLARHLSKPLRRLQLSAAKIAGGDLQHRAEINREDEIGALATSFNEMSAALLVSFSKLQRTLESFERFVPNKFISAIAPQGVENIEVGVALMRTMTILFCDIRGYTSMSEAMAPIEIFTFLNDYLACMAKAIDQGGGFIDKYIGDAIMALFDDAATDGALKAAILMHQALDKFNYERSQKGLPKIAIGIGIHRGEVVMGTVGFTSRIESTVIGDAVNVASRIEGLTKQYNCEVLLTESVVNSLSYPEACSLRLVDKAVKVKGKDEAIAIYELEV
jgi:class 3 adenylate cyclase/HAMP domain-containing protein